MKLNSQGSLSTWSIHIVYIGCIGLSEIHLIIGGTKLCEIGQNILNVDYMKFTEKCSEQNYVDLILYHSNEHMVDVGFSSHNLMNFTQFPWAEQGT